MSLKSRIHSKIQKAFQRTVEDVNNELYDYMTTPTTWAGFENSITYRQNGTVVVGAFRNIEDTGNLVDSQELIFDAMKAEISWDGNNNTPPVQVLLGGISPSGKFIPGRDWISPVLYNFDFVGRFIRYYKAG